MSTLEDFWNKKLAKEGLPEDLPSESQRAAEAGVEVVSSDTLDPESIALSKKLAEEDPRNIFGGFPTSFKGLMSLVNTLRIEWLGQGVKNEDIKVVLHHSCVNDYDCITLVQNGGQRYHYNTKKILGYSRDKVISQFLKQGNIAFQEK